VEIVQNYYPFTVLCYPGVSNICRYIHSLQTAGLLLSLCKMPCVSLTFFCIYQKPTLQFWLKRLKSTWPLYLFLACQCF